MKIAVCLKQVPDTEANIKIASNQKSIDESGIKFIVNPYDEFAIEEALKLKESRGAESVIAITLGPERAKDVLRTAVAMGVDDAILLKTAADSDDALSTAKVLAAKIQEIGAEMIILGKEAIDDGSMQVGPMLSELLNIPCITVVTKLDVNGANIVAEREIDGGSEVLETTLPCIITCQKGLNEPRFPSIRGVMMAKKKQIPEETVEIDNAKLAVSSLAYPQSRSDGKIVGEGVEAVAELIRLLREEAKVI